MTQPAVRARVSYRTYSVPRHTLGDDVPAAWAAVASGWIGLCHRDQPKFRITFQHRSGGCLFDRGVAAKLLVPSRRGYPERLKAARAGERFFHLLSP